MVFYSRYYIQEMALVFFSFAALVFGWRIPSNGKGNLGGGRRASFGAMYATKETCVIAWTALGIAAIATRAVNRRRRESRASARPAYRYAHFAAAAAAALAIAFLFLSGFLTYMRGPWDSLGSYAFYLNRAGLVGAETASASTAIDAAHHHYHPWYFYLNMLLFSSYGPGPWWSEAFILILAVVGGVSAFADGRSAERDHSFVRFLVFYTLVMILIYSAIPYKTPWVMLGFLHGLILLAAVGG
jgi:predicted membrane-bound mannosyltransferase